MIKIEDLTVSYSDTPVLKHLNLQIEDGECVVLTGESGSGKSTLLNAINGLGEKYANTRTKGCVTVDDADVGTLETYQISELVACVFQNPKTHFFNVNTTQELLFFLENIGLERAEMDRRLDKLLKLFPIKALLNRSIFELSGGEKQVLCLASAYISGCKFILLDEPTSNLDHRYIDVLRQMLETLRAEKIALVIAEHRLYYLNGLFDRLVLLKGGEIAKIYTKEEFSRLASNDLHAAGLRDKKPESIKLQPCPATGELYIKEMNIAFTPTSGLELEDLYFKNNCIYGIIGRNGSGKTTFLKALIGVLKKSRESVYYAGQILNKRARLRRSYLVMQDVNAQLFTEAVETELRLKNARVPETEIDSALSSLNLLPYKTVHPMSLSGGQKQRVAVAVGIIDEADFMFFDEPTSGMDYKNMLAVSGCIRGLRNEQRIIFIASHDFEFLNVTCDYVLDMERANELLGREQVL